MKCDIFIDNYKYIGLFNINYGLFKLLVYSKLITFFAHAYWYGMDSMEVLINARSTRMDALCANLDSVLVELMECLDKLEILRKRFSEAVSEVEKRSLL